MSRDNQHTSISMGLDAIFSASNKDRKNIADSKSILSIQTLPISEIQVSPFQARKYFSESALSELASSIQQHGVLQPLLVRKNNQGHYELLAGERRWRAAKLIALPEVPVIECVVDDKTAMAFGLIENIQRQDLNVIEEAEALEKLLHEFKLSHDLLAEKIGKSRSHITNLLRLNKLDVTIKNHLMSGDISMGHARAILALPTEQQMDVVKRLIADGWSVRETENWVKKINESKGEEPPEKKFFLSEELQDTIQSWKKQLHEKYQAHIKININAEGKAKLLLEVDSAEKLSILIDLLNRA
ncbi:MAG: chromosome partitioning protein ParB [Gammaproteobacteria bacterium CG_4_10_14_0_8_um_filter_38_16]|nr:MAG: chromosome partitioning protein ParB [Gammaproteobacteria bacterium CG_4_10_14_0_8_um_filter_38_16]PJA02763.1 MAG: chromosome partitioning protein ParB [Gammaproteobacteria bacterium CG_4_10_14_0_2_um_filter_38_22]PJB10413.1 MAG: chromosome partitioning protein ParB [Gammaproteobacteria bacterium CG_4_9_14_3_um_filter_38_9]